MCYSRIPEGMTDAEDHRTLSANAKKTDGLSRIRRFVV